jgi:YidC/Oxa1 family membrane protein insertase
MRVVAALSRILDAIRQSNSFLKLGPEHRNVVFYSEDDYSFMHFEALIEKLTNNYGLEVCYLTSQHEDPILNHPPRLVRSFFIGSGWSRTSLFLRMRADVLVMTMPDLETYHLKRSKVADVHYLYLFHAMVSTHSNYREFAFDHYDTIFLTGPYQRDEIRATERAYGLPQKCLVDYGYPRLEALINDVQSWRANRKQDGDDTPRVILAPSWGPTTILESIGTEVVHQLLGAGFFVTVRPHPVTLRNRPDVIEELEASFGTSKRFQLECDVRDKVSLYEADVMICDWSGVSIEYAFSCERPVLFIDVPKKKNNSNADRIDVIPIEVSIRKDIGEVIHPNDLNQLPNAVRHCVRNRTKYVDRIRELRFQYVFNLHSSADVGAKHIFELAASRRGRGSVGL